MPELTVVVVAYFGAEDLDRCLSALDDVAPIVVVDNSSSAEVAQVARTHHAWLVDPGGNLGFAAGVNLGLDHVAAGSDVLLLNPDAIITSADVRRLHARLHSVHDPRTAALSPSLRDPVTGAEQRVVWPFPTPARLWREALGLARWFPPSPGFCIGAVLLLRAEALREVGRFDERFFLYAEETDWQRRATDAGWLVSEDPTVVALHVGAGTSADLNRREVLFHAGTETYLRKWSGVLGWQAYRTAAVAGAGVRGLTLRGARATAARNRARLYARGPRAVARLPDRSAAVGRRVTHVVVTSSFAGVEKYVSEVAREQARLGSIVTVIGGDPERMRSRLTGARYVEGATLRDSLHALVRIGRQDIVHAHMTSAETVAVGTAWAHGAPVISTRHFAARRGSTRWARAGGAIIRRRLAGQIAISRFVAEVIEDASTVLPNGVRSRLAPDGVSREQFVLCLQRLEPEKDTELAIRAWAGSGLQGQGWQLFIAGEGSLRDELESLVATHQVASSVRFLGFVADASSLLQAAACLLAPAPAEPFGLSVCEAMAEATPVLASQGGAHVELLGTARWTFPVGDVDEAAEMLRRFAALSSTERGEYGVLLRDRQLQVFDLERHVLNLQAEYDRIITS